MLPRTAGYAPAATGWCRAEPVGEPPWTTRRPRLAVRSRRAGNGRTCAPTSPGRVLPCKRAQDRDATASARRAAWCE